ncbi:hypothetical protein [Mangrovibacillus cuniculi]|uniref:DUF4367 domain-containing protein n=1 Tax=Mangrovibacillus cuniculi TaxID=2593652 RepID=A0A7S8HH94_9BACI|nr:hypothetical protein [Mangrovibacillus cuniculi]QPC48260.1 hypothetical protein G8O30_15700 [Mangrovibacillus cuniculi]
MFPVSISDYTIVVSNPYRPEQFEIELEGENGETFVVFSHEIEPEEFYDYRYSHGLKVEEVIVNGQMGHYPGNSVVRWMEGDELYTFVSGHAFSKETMIKIVESFQ